MNVAPAKDTISLSVVRLRPGYVELGPNRVLNALFLFVALGLFAGGIALLAIGGDVIRVRAPRLGARLPQFTEYPLAGLAIHLDRWIDSNDDARTTVRIAFDQADLPDVRIEDPFFFRAREDREAARAEALARKLRAAFALKSENPLT